MFSGTPFNQPIGNWDVSNVRYFQDMFYASQFNQDISAWDVSNSEGSMARMFSSTPFNQPIGNWNVSNVTSMREMFYQANSFNQDISFWDVSSVTDMTRMFYNASSFNQDLSSWNTYGVSGCENFCIFTSNWELPKPIFNSCNEESGCEYPNPVYLDENGITVKAQSWAEVGQIGYVGDVLYTIADNNTYIGGVAAGATLTKYCTTLVTDMSNLFNSYPNSYISTWDTSNVTNMERMFYDTNIAYADSDYFSSWDVSSVTNMAEMFRNISGINWSNQDISSWDVSSVTDMSAMFVLHLHLIKI